MSGVGNVEGPRSPLGEERSGTQQALGAVGGFLLEMAAGLGAAMLQFLVLGILAAVALALIFWVNVTFGLLFGMVAFAVWAYKTGWVFL